MTDIVERLRNRHRALHSMPGGTSLCAEAADEIERLREQHRALHAHMDYRLAATRSDALEEAAKVAEACWDYERERGHAGDVAAAIRELKEKP